jgi:hypothetical protein
VAPLLEQRLEMTGRHIAAGNLGSLLDSLMRRMLEDAFEDAKAHEGLVWLLEPGSKELTVAWQTGRLTRDWVGSMRLPAGTGLQGLVLASQQPHCANQLYANSQHDGELDRRLGGVLCAEIIIPFYIARQLKGLVMALQIKPGDHAPDPEGFDLEALEEIELLAASLGRLLDYRLLCTALGMEE